MAKKFKFELNREGVRQLMQSEEMKKVCLDHAQATASAAGAGYVVTTHVGRNRVNASVKADTPEAIRDNLDNNTLLKALQ